MVFLIGKEHSTAPHHHILVQYFSTHGPIGSESSAVVSIPLCSQTACLSPTLTFHMLMFMFTFTLMFMAHVHRVSSQMLTKVESVLSELRSMVNCEGRAALLQ